MIESTWRRSRFEANDGTLAHMARSLPTRAFGGLAFLALLLSLAVFASAGTLDYWHAWVFLAVFMGAWVAIMGHLLRADPALVERRLAPKGKETPMQRVSKQVVQFSFLAIFVVSGLDHRFAWSILPPWVVAASDVLVPTGLFIVVIVFRANTYAARAITIEAGQRLISTGPYAWVRHPMYAGGILGILSTPLALGSVWGILGAIPMVAGILWRLFEEERFLAKNLRGYAEYREKVRSRLIPGLF